MPTTQSVNTVMVRALAPPGPTDSLQEFAGVTEGDVVVVNAYSKLGDRGGGQFYFEGAVPNSAKITKVTSSQVAVTGVSLEATGKLRLRISTAPSNHGFTTGDSVRIAITGGSPADGTWIIDANTGDPTKFFLDGTLTDDAGTNQTGTASTTRLTMAAAHGRGAGQRVSIAGMTGDIGDALNGQWDMIGAAFAAPTVITIPTYTFETYSGNGGIIGDDALVVPVSDGSGRWLRTETSPRNVRWFGAKGDGVTDDQPAFFAAINAIGTQFANLSAAGRTGLSVSSGDSYDEGRLAIHRFHIRFLF